MNKILLSIIAVSALVWTSYGDVQVRQSKNNPTGSKTSTTNISSKDTKFSGSWRMKLGAEKLNDEISQGTVTNLSGSMKLDYQLIETLRFYGEPKISSSQGQAQSLYGEFEPNNSFSVDEALINFAPHEFVDFNAGILSHQPEKRIGNSYLMANAPFPGIEISIHVLNFEKVKLDLLLEESIPTSYSLDSGVQEREATPRFHAQSIKLDLGHEKDYLRSKTFLTKYQFDNLPSIVAQKSLTKGNTVTDGYHFDYKFSGYSLSTEVDFDLNSSLTVLGVGSYLVNDEAPKGLGTGYSWGGGFDYYIAKDLIFTSKIEKFYNEPDIAPAYYSTYQLGLNNRQGYIYEVGLEFSNLNLKLKAGYMDSDLVYKSGLMAKRTSYSIKLETLDVKF